MTNNKLYEALFAPKSIALIGASGDARKNTKDRKFNDMILGSKSNWLKLKNLGAHTSCLWKDAGGINVSLVQQFNQSVATD